MLARPAMQPQCAGGEGGHTAPPTALMGATQTTKSARTANSSIARITEAARPTRRRLAVTCPPTSARGASNSLAATCGKIGGLQPSLHSQAPQATRAPPRQNPWGPPRYPPPATFGQYMAQAGVNPWTPLQQCSQGYNELEYPVLANNPWLRKPRGPQGPKKNATGHKNGQGKPQQPPQERAQQPARDKQPAQPKPLATRLAPAAPAQRTPPPRQPQVSPAPEADMLIDLAPEQPTAPPMRTEQPAQPGLADFMQVLTKSSTFNKDSTLAETIVPMCQLMVIWCDPAISLPDKVHAMMGFVQTLAAKLNGSS
ncbi:basic salivary proline-rich protein 2-like [Bacillus rossius redtenbacheri]|uniref:basic salivary proline-rich protein 2-like n=1 Tax=Bacillus rossius redtenbacheri TaxID=93214 RepID=UPI002FDDF7ED